MLLLYGRLEAATISRRAEVSPRLTRQSLAVMIQHNFVQFTQVSEGAGDRVFYVCNWKEVMTLLQTGSVMLWASKEVSAEAAALVKYVSIYGKAKAGDVTSAFNPVSTASDASSKAPAFEDVLLQLVQKKILRVSHLHEAKPLEDFKQSIRDEEILARKTAQIPETRKAKEVEEHLNRRLQALQAIADSPDTGLKRKADVQDDGRARKRMRTNDDAKPAVDPEAMLRVNHDKYAVHQRNEALVVLCQKRLGPTPAAVYRFILKELEPKIFSCRQDTSDVSITTLAISRIIPSDFDLQSVWATLKASQGKSKHSKTPSRPTSKSRRRNSDGELESDEGMSDEEADSEDDDFVENDVNDLASDEDFDPNEQGSLQNGDRIKMVNRFCELFAMDSLKFLRKIGTRSMGEWQVDYSALSQTLRQLEIESMVQQKFGDLAPRLLRIVKDKIKVDEKQLSTIALLKQKDIRHVLTSLHEVGALDLQEVPKRLDRQPSMTYFLWFHNPARAVSCMAQDLCKGLARIHQRLQFELQNRKRLLDKSQRTDVRNKESEYLSKGELAELRKIRLVEEKLLAQSARLENSYSILIDF